MFIVPVEVIYGAQTIRTENFYSVMNLLDNKVISFQTLLQAPSAHLGTCS